MIADSNNLFKEIIKQIFDLRCKSYLDDEQVGLETFKNLNLELQFERTNGEKKLIEKQTEFIQFKKEIYEELNEKLKKQNKVLQRANSLLKYKTKFLLNDKLESLQSELQKYENFFFHQELQLQQEQERVLKFMEKNFNQKELSSVWQFLQKFDSKVESDFLNLQQKWSSDSTNSLEPNILSEMRYNSQSKRETCIIKPFASQDSNETAASSNAENNSTIKDIGSDHETRPQKLTTMIEKVIDKPIKSMNTDKKDLTFKRPGSIETGQISKISEISKKLPVVKKTRFESPIEKTEKNDFFNKSFKFDDSFSANFNFKFGNGSDENVKEKSGGFFMMADDEENNGENSESFHFAF